MTGREKSRGEPRACRARAFTLIELMVVIGLIVVLAAGVGIAVAGRGGEGAALANAQNMVSSLVGLTRVLAKFWRSINLLAYGNVMDTFRRSLATAQLRLVAKE